MFKTCTFTIMHLTIAFGVAYLLTGSWVLGGAIAVIEPLCNSVGYYFHEKIWDRMKNKPCAFQWASVSNGDGSKP